MTLRNYYEAMKSFENLKTLSFDNQESIEELWT